jgi:hypothetical protein
MSDQTRASPLLSRRALVGGGAAAAAGVLLARPAGAQQSILWYSASASGADEEWSKMFKAKTGAAVEYFRIGGVIRCGVRREAGRCRVVSPRSQLELRAPGGRGAGAIRLLETRIIRRRRGFPAIGP